jgi:hypothetical protein
MNNQWMKIRAGVMLIALTFVATAAVSAQQWTSGANQRSTPFNSVMTTNFGDMPAATVAQDSYTITLNQTGDLEGRIASDAFNRSTNSSTGLNVYFLRNGKIAHQTQTDLNGNFQLPQVDQGTYSFIVTGPTGFAAYGIQVQGNTDGQNNVNVMDAAIVSPRISGIQQVLIENLPSQIADEIMQASMQTAQPTPTTGLKKVRLVNGQLHGQVTSVANQGSQVPGTIVNLIQNGTRVADVQVDQQGNFSIPDLEPGVYDFIAVGFKGIAAIQFEAVGQNSPITQISYRRTPKLIATMLVVSLTDPTNNSATEQAVDYTVEPESYPVYDAPVEYAGDSTGYGSAAGGTAGCNGGCPTSSAPVRGGGFGGRFGGGRGGRILGLAGIGLGAAALATNGNNDDDFGGGYPPPPPPQSPYGGYGYGGYGYGGGGYYGGGYGSYGN